MKLSIFALIFAFVMNCYAQDITVHVIDDRTQKPLKGIALDLRTDCFNPKRPKASQQTTDASGTSVFHAVSLAGEPLCIDLFSVAFAYAPHNIDYVFASPERADQLKTSDKLLNPIVTTLPADVTFHVQKRSLTDRLHFLFLGD
jgi:hypothetical protein